MRWSFLSVLASLALGTVGCASEAGDRPSAATLGQDRPAPEGDANDVMDDEVEAIGPGARPDAPPVEPTLPRAASDEDTDLPEGAGDAVVPTLPNPDEASDSPRSPKPVAADEAQGGADEEAPAGAAAPPAEPDPAEADPLGDPSAEEPSDAEADDGPAGGDAENAAEEQDTPEAAEEGAPEDAGDPAEAPREGANPEEPGNGPDGPEGDDPVNEDLCARATEHLRGCIGISISPDACVDAAAAEAQLLLALTCEELENLRSAGGGSAPLCTWLGWGCDALNPCVPAFTAEHFHQVVDHASVEELNTAADVMTRLQALTELMVERDDPRGLFATTYAPITAVALEAIEDDAFEDGAWAEDLVVDFAGRYLNNLRNHLLAGEVTLEWRRHYELAETCDVSRLRTVATGISTHLIVDLPYALQAIETAPEREVDFTTFGELLVTATPAIISDLEADYGVDGEAFLTGFFAGDIIDASLGELTTTSFMFQTVRTKAWQNGQLLLAPATSWIAFTEILSSWGAADALLRRLAERGTI